MMSVRPVTIFDRQSGSPVEALLHADLDELRLIDVEIDWAPERLRGLRRLRERGAPAEQLPQHIHWSWALKALHHTEMLSYRCLGIEAAGKMQGLMMVCLSGWLARLEPDVGRRLVYVDYLETAPWNAREFTDSPRYKGVGVRLMHAAIELSIDQGCAGRVGLHGLAQASSFYSGTCTMQGLGPDPSYHDLEYFEFTAAKAFEFLVG